MTNLPRAATGLFTAAVMVAMAPGFAGYSAAAAEFSTRTSPLPPSVAGAVLLAPGAAMTPLTGTPALAPSLAPAAGIAPAPTLPSAAASPAPVAGAASDAAGQAPRAEGGGQLSLDFGEPVGMERGAAGRAEALGDKIARDLDGRPPSEDESRIGKPDPAADLEARQSQSVPRKVGALRVLTQENPAAALQAAVEILRNPEEKRYEIRVAALRALEQIGTEASDVELLAALQSEKGYYLKIEAVKMIGRAAARLPKERTVAVLEKLYQDDSNQSVRIAARWALSRFGIEKPEVAYDYKQAIVGLGTRAYWKVRPYLLAAAVAAAIYRSARYVADAYYAGEFTFADVRETVVSWLPYICFLLMIGVVIWGVLSQTGKSFTKTKKIRMERPNVKFTDVAGIDDAMIDVQELVEMLKDPVRFKRLGGKLPKGVLIKGPPGTGKSLMAKALAGTAGVPFYYMSGSSFDEVFVGVGSSRVRKLFEEAKKHSPSIIFIDEFDAIAKTRSNFPGSGESNNTLNALLTEMDGFDSGTDVIVIAATNLDAVLDTAATRPGRFDRSVYVGNPHVLGREAILQLHAKSRRLGPDVDLRRIAERTTGFSGAGLATLVNEAALLAARRRASAVEMKDFDAAVDKMLVGAERERFMNPETMTRTSKHEIGHVLGHMFGSGATLEQVLKNPQKISSIVSIVPRGEGTLGFAHSSNEEDNLSITKRRIESDLVMILGGYVAEELAYGPDDVSTGPGSDLRHATQMARMMIETAGFSKTLGLEVTAPNQHGVSHVSERTKELKDEEVRRILDGAKDGAARVLKEYADLALLLERELLDKETLSREEMLKIIREYARKLGK